MVVNGTADIVEFDARQADGTPVRLKGLLTSAGSAGPAPVVVMLPGGPGGPFPPYCYRAMVEQFASWGFATLMVASASARFQDGRPVGEYSFADQAHHAYGAAAALKSLMNADGVVLWGHSHGGLSAIDAVSVNGQRADLPFRAAIAAAPVCPGNARKLQSPLLLIVGTADRVISVEWCRTYAAQLQDGSDFEFLVLEDAGHAYWAPAATGSSETAAARAADRTREFLERYLRSAR